jgi:hypothetical protein
MRFVKRQTFSPAAALLLAALLARPGGGSQLPQSFDVLVYGGTAAGIAAAVNAAESGRTVALVEPTARVGGVVTGGLSYTDFKSFEAIGGTFRDYTRRVERYYRDKYGADSQQVKDCYFGVHAEPHVALAVFRQMLAEQPRVKLFLRHRLESVALASPREGAATINAARFQPLPSSETVELRARVFIDATYEGDLAAFAGAPYKVGRESTREYGERLAGHLYYHDRQMLPGSTGEGDARVQCYNYRLTMTRRPDNRVPVSRPANYDRAEFAPVIEHFKSGRVKQVFTVTPEGILRTRWMPNEKADINDIKGAPLRMSLMGENYDYPDGDYAARERIVARHRDYTLGLIWFLQNDPEVPAAIRAEASEWGLAKDEFEETGHFTPQLYIREARRIVGEYVFTERDALMGAGSVRAPLHKDSIAIGDYSLNCHGEQPPGKFHPSVAEGDFSYPTVPFQIPYGVIVPRKVANLLVPVAVSASHVGYSALRLEYTYTAMGQAAGIAAHVALARNVPVNKVPVEEVQKILHERGAYTVYFADVDARSPYFRAAQYFGTRGFFHHLIDPRQITFTPPKPLRPGHQYSEAMPQHAAALDQPVDEKLARHWIGLLPSAALRERANANAALRADGRLTRGEFLRRLYQLVTTESNGERPQSG